MHLSKRDYGVLESRAILILTAVGWMSTEKRACMARSMVQDDVICGRFVKIGKETDDPPRRVFDQN